MTHDPATPAISEHQRRPATAVQWFRKAAEAGNASGQYSLGLAYLSGQGIKADTATGLQWLHKAAEQGDLDARNALENALERLKAVEEPDKP